MGLVLLQFETEYIKKLKAQVITEQIIEKGLFFDSVFVFISCRRHLTDRV